MTEVGLARFLLERFAEDESIARDAQHQALAGRPFITVTAGGTGVRRLTDPGWWLDDLAAKRRIVEQMETDRLEDPRWKGYHLGWRHAQHRTLRLLALPYAGHPDYREEWKP